MSETRDFLELRFNSGHGALLCPNCRTIVAYGFEHEGREYTCSHCAKTIRVERANNGALVAADGEDT